MNGFSFFSLERVPFWAGLFFLLDRNITSFGSRGALLTIQESKT
jgi:hypothetical protein